MEIAVKYLLVSVKKRVELMGERENDMKIRCVNDFRTSLVHPDLFFDSLAVGAVAVAVGIVVYLCMATVPTDA